MERQVSWNSWEGVKKRYLSYQERGKHGRLLVIHLSRLFQGKFFTNEKTDASTAANTGELVIVMFRVYKTVQ